MVLRGFKEIPRLAVFFVLCLGEWVMSVEGYAQGLVYFEAWYYVPSGYSFDISGEYIDFRAIYGHFLGST